MNRMLTVQQTSDLLHVHGETVRQWLRSGKLRGVKMGARSWRIPESALRELTGESESRSERAPVDAMGAVSGTATPSIPDFLAQLTAFHKHLDEVGYKGADGAELVNAGRRERMERVLGD